MVRCLLCALSRAVHHKTAEETEADAAAKRDQLMKQIKEVEIMIAKRKAAAKKKKT